MYGVALLLTAYSAPATIRKTPSYDQDICFSRIVCVTNILITPYAGSVSSESNESYIECFKIIIIQMY